MDKKQINEGLVRGNIKPIAIQNGFTKGVAKPPTQAVKPPPPAPKK